MRGRFLTAAWEDLVMLTFEADGAALRPLTPRGVELDDFHGRHLVSIVAFRFRDTRLFAWPVPFHREFEEINLRFYVRRREGNETRRGVVFVREVVPRRAVAAVARWAYNESYVCHRCGSDVRRPRGQSTGRAEYRWEHNGNMLAAGAEFVGDPLRPAEGSLTEFIAEHYWGYVRQRDGSTKEYRVEHRPWRVWTAKRHWLSAGIGDFYGPPLGSVLNGEPAAAFVADGSAVTVYRGRPLVAT